MRTETIYRIVEFIDINKNNLATILIDIQSAYGDRIFENALDILISDGLKTYDDIDENELLNLLNKEYDYYNIAIKDYRPNNLTNTVEVQFTYNEKRWYKTEDPKDTDSNWRKTEEYKFSRISEHNYSTSATFDLNKCLK